MAMSARKSGAGESSGQRRDEHPRIRRAMNLSASLLRYETAA